MDAAFSLNGFKHDCPGEFRDGFSKAFGPVESGESKTGKKRLESLSVFGGSGGGEGTHGASVKSVFGHQNFQSFRFFGLVRNQAGKFDHCLIGFRSAVAKKDFAGANPFNEPFGQSDLFRDRIEVGGMGKYRALLGDPIDPCGMPMPDIGDCNPRGEIEVFLSIGIP